MDGEAPTDSPQQIIVIRPNLLAFAMPPSHWNTFCFITGQ